MTPCRRCQAFTWCLFLCLHFFFRRLLCVLCVGVECRSIGPLGSSVRRLVARRPRISRRDLCAAAGGSDVACFHPVRAFRTADGGIAFDDRGVDAVASLDLRCGQCVGCRQDRAREWTVRVMHEAQLHDESCFITLTYSDEEVPKYGSLNYADFQRFMKRMRRDLVKPIRFFMCGEYGEELGRPHFHAAVFGFGFREDRYVWKKSGSGEILFRSPRLERLWPFGHSSVGDLTEQSAAYIARYVFKKVNGSRADWHYRRVDVETGEVAWLEPEFVRMSLKPGIGARWCDQFGATDAFAHDRVVFKGREVAVPRYYLERLKRQDADAAESIVMERSIRARGKDVNEVSPERLATREAVAAARLSFFKRKLK